MTEIVAKMRAEMARQVQEAARCVEAFLSVASAEQCSEVADICFTAMGKETEFKEVNDLVNKIAERAQEDSSLVQCQVVGCLDVVESKVVDSSLGSLATSEVADVDNHTDVDMCSEEAVYGHNVISSDVCEALQDSLSGQTIKKDSVTIDFLDGTLTRRRCHETRVAALPNRVVEGSMNQLGPSALENVCSEQCQKLCDVAKISFATVDAASVKYSDTSVKCVNADELGGSRTAGTGVREMPPPPHSLTHPLPQTSGQKMETGIAGITRTTTTRIPTTTTIGGQEFMEIYSPMMKTTIAGNEAAVVVINTGGRPPPHPLSHAATEAATVAATAGWPSALDISASVFTEGAAGIDIQDSGGRCIKFSVNQGIKGENQLYAGGATVTGGRASYGCQLGWSAFEEIWPEQGQDFCEVAKVSVPGVGNMFRSQDTIFSGNAGKSQDAGLSGMQIPPPHAHQPLTRHPPPRGKITFAVTGTADTVAAAATTTGSLSTSVHVFIEGTCGVDSLQSLLQVDKCSGVKAATESPSVIAAAVENTAVHLPRAKTGVGPGTPSDCLGSQEADGVGQRDQAILQDLEESWSRRIANQIGHHVFESAPYWTFSEIQEFVLSYQQQEGCVINNCMDIISDHVIVFDGGTVLGHIIAYESYLDNLVNVNFDTDHMSRVLNKNVRHGDSGNHIIVYMRLDGGDHDNVDCLFLINICDTFIEYDYHKCRLSNADTSVPNRNYFTLDILVDNDNLLEDDNMSVKYEDSMFSNNDIDNKNVIIWLIKFIVMFINLIKWVTYVWIIISHSHLKSVELF